MIFIKNKIELSERKRISVFEVDKEDFEKINKSQINQEFINECFKVSEQLKKNKEE